jgi:hypothetical protein
MATATHLGHRERPEFLECSSILKAERSPTGMSSLRAVGEGLLADIKAVLQESKKRTGTMRQSV